MQVDKINNTSFKAVTTKPARDVLFKRLSNHKRYIQYKNFIADQDKKNFDIVLNKGSKRTLSATVYNKEGVFLFSENENILNGILNINPLNFLRKVSKAAEKFKY